MKHPTAKRYHTTAVDLEILRLLQTYHYLTTEQIVKIRYSPNSLPTAQVRMKALFEAGFVGRRRLPSLSTGNTSFVYYLSTKGRDLLEEDMGSAIAGRVRTDDIEHMQYPFLQHVLSLNDFLIAASQLPSFVPAISLAEMRHDLDLKKTPVRLNVPDSKLREKVTVIPDAWLDIRMILPDRPKPRRKCLVIELDRGTTSITPLKQKLRALYYFACSEAYVQMFGTDLCQVAYATTAGEARLHQLLNWCEQELAEQQLTQEANLYRFACLPEDTTYNPFQLFCSPLWYKPFEEEPVPLL